MPMPTVHPHGGIGVRATVLAAVLTTGLVLAGCGSHAATPTVSTPVTTPHSSTSSRPAPDPSKIAASKAAARAKALRSARMSARADVARVVREVPDGAAGVAAVNLNTGASYVGGSRQAMWTASMYKLLVLETLLRQDGPLSGGELDTAVSMIENSDNAAGWTLWEAADGNAGLTETLHALHMDHSVADGTDPTFTRLTPSDALQMVRALVRPNEVLSPASQRQALDLMTHVESDQRWGIGVVADKGDDFANKNGWLSVGDDNGPGENDGGRWAVTSVGIVRVHGQRLLLASMSNHNDSMGDGVKIIQALATDAATIVARPPR